MKKLLILLSLMAFALHAYAVVPHGDPDPEKYMSIDISGSTCKGREITITVTKYSGDPLRDVDIDLFLMNRKVAYGKTDSNGAFIFKPDDAGSYKLSAKRSGYEDAEAVVNVSRNCGVIITTTSTTTTTSSTTFLITSTSTTTSLTTSTTKQTCNYNRYCDIRNQENYMNCPSDCAGSADGYCDRLADGRCDPDCARTVDSDCLCNGDGRCERGYEDYIRCPKDCPSGSADGICDKAQDGRCDPDCNETTDAECRKTDYSGIILPAIVVIIIFGVIAVLNMKREMKNMRVEKADDDLIDELIKRLKEGEDPEELRKELLSEGRGLKLLEKAEERLWE